MSKAIKVFISYSHQDEDHHRRVEAHLTMLQSEGIIDSWSDNKILPSTNWSNTIETRLESSQIILFLVSRNFLSSEYIREHEIPKALALEKNRHASVVPVILDECDWKNQNLSKFQALPPSATPVTEWPHRDTVYAEIARGIRAIALERRAGIVREVELDRENRSKKIFRHTPLRLLGENYDPFRAFSHIFWRIPRMNSSSATHFPFDLELEDRVDFDGVDYHTILARLRNSSKSRGLPYDLVAIPYFLLGYCVENRLIQPLSDSLATYENDFAWWHEMGFYKDTLFGVPLSALTMILAIRRDLFDKYELSVPETWDDYFSVIDAVMDKNIRIAPDLLQGRSHISLWYDWLNHLYAHDSNDLVLYGGSRLPAREAAETLRSGTRSFLALASKLASFANGSFVNRFEKKLPHWAISNWDNGINEFAQGNLLMHIMFNDALDTLRRRMKIQHSSAKVEFRPIPRAFKSNQHNGHVEGWVICITNGTRYFQAANELLKWFLRTDVQSEYAKWGGASANFKVIEEQLKNSNDAYAVSSFQTSIDECLHGQSVIDLVKEKGPQSLEVIDRIVVNLYDAVLAVAGEKQPVEKATDIFISRVEERLASG